MCRKLLLLTPVIVVLALTQVAVGTLSGLADVTVVDGAIVSLRYAGTEYVVANGDLVLGTTTRWYVVDGVETLWAEGDPAPAATVSGTSSVKEGDVGSNADNFTFAIEGDPDNICSLDGIDFQVTIFPYPTDTVFLFERGGNDAGSWQGILEDGSLGAAVAFDKASNGGPYADTGDKSSGQNAYGVVFTTDVPVIGVRITASGHDTLSISTPAIELAATEGATYVWNGGAGDGLWDTPANWTVIDSIWTWPNEEAVAAAVADPTVNVRNVNYDTIAIDILTGGAVSRIGEVAIQGAADGSTTGVLTLDASSLTVDGRLAVGGRDGTKGQIDILGGSTVTITGDGSDLYVADNGSTLATLNIVDSTVDIADDLTIDAGEGYVNISGNSTINADDMIAGNGTSGVGYVDIRGTATINLDELKTNAGEGHITIGGDATLNLDDLFIDNATGVGTVDIGGSATITIVDDVLIDEATGTLTIGGSATVSNGDDFAVGDDAPGVGYVNIGDDATVTVGDLLYVAHNANSEGHLTINGNATVNILNDLIVANAAGVTATLHISGNPTIDIASEFIMNDDSSDPMVPSTSEVTMDGGTVNVASNSNLNDDNNGTATFTMNGGRWYCGGYLNLSDNLDGTAHLTMNGGEMITGGALRLGKDGGADTGQVRIFLNGGLLQAEGLDIKITDTQIIYTGGVLRIGNIDVAEMEQLIADGTIVADGVHSVITNGDFTELNSVSPAIPQGPTPADGDENVRLGSSLVWTPGNTTATNELYFGTTNPPALIVTQEGGSYYPGPIEPGVAYYWQVISVEADGTTKHTGDLWTFTAGFSNADVELDIRIASSLDDAEEDLNPTKLGEIDETSTDLEMPYEDPGMVDPQLIGLRYTGIPLPAASTIHEAWVRFQVDETKEGTLPVNLVIEGELNPNPGEFVAGGPGTFNISTRSRTATNVAWSVPNWETGDEQGANQTTSDLSPIITELIGQPGWASGNALALIISDDPANPSTGIRAAESFDGDPSGAALLHISASVASDAAVDPSPADGAVGVVEATLFWWPGASAVSHDVYFGTTSPPALLGSTVQPSIDAGVTAVDTTYYWQVNSIAADGTVHTGDIWSFKGTRTGTGSIARQTWLNVGPGNDIATLRAHPDFPANPTSTDELPSFQTEPESKNDEYGSRLQGYLHPETSGDYLFWIASDDNGELWLSTDESPTNAVLISSVSASTGYLNFDDPDVTPSGSISLEAGRKYYIEAIYKEGGGGDHCAVAWQGPDSPKRAVIHGYYLSPFAQVTAFGPDPADGATEVARTAVLSWQGADTAVSHDVYIGTANPPALVGNQTATSYTPPEQFAKGATYYWRVDEVEADGTIQTGDVWSFTVTSGGR